MAGVLDARRHPVYNEHSFFLPAPMSANDFVHLRAHTQFSIDDGLLDPEDLVALAAADGQGAIAITDASKMFGTVAFYKAARSAGVKPIVGVDVFIDCDVTDPQSQEEDAEPSRMLLLAQDEAGYKRLMDLLSRSYVENMRHGKPRIRQSWLRDAGTEGLVALSGGEQGGEIEGRLLSGDAAGARQSLDAYRQWFGENFYLEVQRAGFPGEDALVPALASLSSESGVPLVATHPIQFGDRADYFTHEVKVCIGAGKVVNDIQRTTPFTREQSFKTRQEMAELFSDLPQALDNAGALAKRLSISVDLGKPRLPIFPTENGETEEQMFVRESRAGLERRLERIFPDASERAAKRQAYDERLQSELDIISNMGFAGYYLIVSDFIRWAKDQGIPVGPGRGSGAGSLAAYALQITDLDPLPYDLLFERFLNPERVSMPDFDIDFCSARRDEVIDYVFNKYGEDKVAQISTFSFLRAKAALRDGARALGLPYMIADSLSKLFPNKIPPREGADDERSDLERVYDTTPALRERIQDSQELSKLFKVALSIEDKPRAIGRHAGGVLIAPTATTDFAPLYLAEAGDPVVSQYDKDDVEAAGLVKFDFLAIAVLDAIQNAVDMINARDDRKDQPPVDISRIDINDQEVYRFLGDAKTVGIFQFESSGMRAHMKGLKPSSLEDLISLAALYRPGPMALIPEFIERRHGRVPVEYPHPMLEKVLAPTYGIIVYQEQVMQIAQVMGGYSLGGADLLRRAMGKKKPEEMAKERVKFEAGARANGVDPATATSVFNLMEKFAEYGFNKSHAAAYALVAYQTAWLKHYYPAEFYAGTINTVIDKTPKVMKFVGDARANGVTVLPPDVNQATPQFSTSAEGLVYGLQALKGVGKGAAEQIVAVREQGGPFESFLDFCVRTKSRAVNKKAIEALVCAGAFDKLDANRARLLASLDDAIKYASDMAKAKPAQEETLVPDLFDAAPKKKKRAPKKAKVIVAPELADVPAWTEEAKLERELETLGFYMSGHPYDRYKERLGGLKSALPLSELDHVTPGETRFVAGVVTSVRKLTTKAKREEMAFIQLDDGVEQKDVTFFPKSWAQCSSWVKPGAFVAVNGKVEADSFGAQSNDEEGEDVVAETTNKMLAYDVLSFDELSQKLIQGVSVAIRKPDLAKLRPVLDEYADEQGLPVSVYMPHDNDRYYKADVSARIANTPRALSALRAVAGEKFVAGDFADEVVFEKPFEQRGPRRNNGPRR